MRGAAWQPSSRNRAPFEWAMSAALAFSHPVRVALPGLGLVQLGAVGADLTGVLHDLPALKSVCARRNVRLCLDDQVRTGDPEVDEMRQTSNRGVERCREQHCR